MSLPAAGTMYELSGSQLMLERVHLQRKPHAFGKSSEWQQFKSHRLWDEGSTQHSTHFWTWHLSLRSCEDRKMLSATHSSFMQIHPGNWRGTCFCPGAGAIRNMMSSDWICSASILSSMRLSGSWEPQFYKFSLGSSYRQVVDPFPGMCHGWTARTQWFRP